MLFRSLIVLAGATPIFADIDKDTLMVTADTIEERLSERTRLIIPVHFAGAPADMGPIRRLSESHSLHLIEDAAHALGTEYRGERIGRRGTAIFSFHPIKNITTGEGGMLCSDDPELLDRIRRLKFHGLGSDAYDRQDRGTWGRSPRAEVLEPGYKYNMTDISAAIGIGQLERVDEFNRKRAVLAASYRERLEEIEEIIPVSDPPYPMRHCRHLFIVRLDTEKAGIERDEFMDRLKDRNIGTGLHFLAVHLHRYYRDTLNVPPGALPNTEWNSRRICSLPLFPGMTADDVDDVVAAVKDVLRKPNE